jgi:hypothetical protein
MMREQPGSPAEMALIVDITNRRTPMKPILLTSIKQVPRSAIPAHIGNNASVAWWKEVATPIRPVIAAAATRLRDAAHIHA